MKWQMKSDHAKITAQFLQAYFHIYENRRCELITQFCDNSIFTFNGADYTGPDNIIKKLELLPYNSRFVVSTVDSVPAYNNILPVFVTGMFHTGNNTQPVLFSQSFQLLRMRGDYLILNNFLRVNIMQDVLLQT